MNINRSVEMERKNANQLPNPFKMNGRNQMDSFKEDSSFDSSDEEERDIIDNFTGGIRTLILHSKRFDPRKFDLHGISHQELSDLKEAFDLFDADGNESIDPSEIMDAMRDLAVQIDASVINEFFEHRKQINFQQMIRLMDVETLRHTEEEMMEVFDHFDVKKSGYIDINALRQFSKSLGQDEEEGTLQEMVNSMDTNGTGRISKKQFVKMFLKFDGNEKYEENNN